jgi:hypothetical protein
VPENTSPKLKVADSRFLLLTEPGSDRVTAEMNSEVSIPLQTKTDWQFEISLPSSAFPGRVLRWMEQFEVEMRETYRAETGGSQVARDLWVPYVSPGETRGEMS